MMCAPVTRTATVAALLVALVAPVHADRAGLDSSAKTHFELGQTYSSAGRYVEALAEFSAGYELSRKPLFLFNMAECARLAGDPARARINYERYLAEDPQGKLAPTARDRLSQLADGTPPEPPPARQDLHAQPPAPLPPSPPRPFPRLRAAAIAVGALSLVSIIVAAPLYASASADRDALVPTCSARPCGPDDWAEPQARANASYALFAIGGVAAAADIALWIASGVRRPPRPAAASGVGLAIEF